MLDEKTLSYKYIQLAMLLQPMIPQIKKHIAEKKFVIMDKETFKNMYNNESTFRLVMFAYDIIVSSSKESGQKVFILRNRVNVKDKTPKYWKKTIRKLRRLMKDDIWKMNVEMYSQKNYEIGQILSTRKNRYKLER